MQSISIWDKGTASSPSKPKRISLAALAPLPPPPPLFLVAPKPNDVPYTEAFRRQKQTSLARMKRRPLPLMADAHQEATHPVPLPSRIKRNTACTSCRDAKVRCNPSSNPDQPCQRCAKLQLTCVVDKTHKRLSRRSKLDELAQEIQSIKESVGSASSNSLPASNAVITPSRDSEQLGITSPSTGSSRSRQHVAVGPVGTGAIEPPVALNTPVTTVIQDTSTGPSLPRTLGSYPFSGEDIDYYFQKFFECYHPYMPVVRYRDANKCYESCPLLFWTIIYVASLRYAKSKSLITFLSEEIRRQVFMALGEVPITLPTLNAIILICSWIFPSCRFHHDPSVMLSSMTTNAALLLGLHTGKGGHPEYSHGVFKNNFTDEEATYTWAGLNIVSQRVSSFMGLPPVTSLFNQTIQNTIDGRTPFHVPSGFRILLECQKFSNHISKIVLANLQESSGVSTHIVQVLEDEWNTLQGMICSERADDLDRFNALLVRLEIQVYYMMPAPGYSPRLLKQLILRTYHTATSVLQNVQELDQKIGLLSHITYPQFRSLITASCVIFKLLRSSYMQFLDRKSVEATAADAISICERLSVVEGDMPLRLKALLKTFLELYHSSSDPGASWQTEEPVAANFRQRLGAAVTFDCLMSWKSDGRIKRGPNQQTPNPPNENTGEETDTLLAGIVPDSLAIDWTFMDDFEWTWTPPGLAPPINLWHGMAR
ncbi:hypothetical protein F5B22DRAFT_648486 [Xylaria bambusicola]|uniref:uncharacterized protein n=1 Tax=Xylaria bambusicola TaxID=326684 RepID=UPI0020082A75|nr:uncharacterized protein F5B22DRAFT_648486 [Xylaria bambusicola]KAI0512636.1 hypothetical protein F5B22DRAFT_648486 [Xylaria bambusicola]